MHNKRILELDGLRAIAVMLVVYYHMVDFSGAITGANSEFGSVVAVLGSGGVYMFFVISGFIITSLLIREWSENSQVSLVAFYRRRFLRILPPFAVYLFTLFVLCQVGYITIPPLNFLWSSFFLTDLDLLGPVSGKAWFVGHTWSLSVEEQYYLILPPIMVVVLKFRFRSMNFLVVTLFCLSLLSLKLAKELSQHVYPALIKFSVFYKFRHIFTGVFFALHKQYIQAKLRGLSIGTPLILIVIIVATNLAQTSTMVGLFLSAADPIAYGFLVLWVVANPEKCAMLRWSWVQWIGASSYSIYLWQQLFTGKANFYNGWTISTSPLSLVAILACAALSYCLIERPSIQLSRAISNRLLHKRAALVL